MAPRRYSAEGKKPWKLDTRYALLLSGESEIFLSCAVGSRKRFYFSSCRRWCCSWLWWRQQGHHWIDLSQRGKAETKSEVKIDYRSTKLRRSRWAGWCFLVSVVDVKVAEWQMYDFNIAWDQKFDFSYLAVEQCLSYLFVHSKYETDLFHKNKVAAVRVFQVLWMPSTIFLNIKK